MAISKIFIDNLDTSPRAVSIAITRARQIAGTIAVGGSMDVSTIATIDELNRDASLQTDITNGKLRVRLVIGTTDLADLPVVQRDIRPRTLYPQITFMTGQTVSAATPGAKTVKGAALLQARVQATSVFGSGTSSVSITANRPGTNGNLITVVLQTGGGEAISVSGGALAGENLVARTITVTSNNGTSTGNTIATLINADATAKKLVRATGGGAGTTLGYATQTLAGGTGAGFKIYIGGLEQDIINTMSDTSIPMQTVALTGMANLDIANMYVLSDNTVSLPQAVMVVT